MKLPEFHWNPPTTWVCWCSTGILPLLECCGVMVLPLHSQPRFS